jgi:hypothetical protein
MKDTKGAEYAVRVAQEVWKGHRPNPPVAPPHRAPMASPANVGVGGPVPPGSRPQQSPHLPRGGPPHGYIHPPFLGPPMMGHIGYSPMGITPVTPYGQPPRALDRSGMPRLLPKIAQSAPTKKGTKRSIEEVTPRTKVKKVTPVTKSPRAPAVRIQFDPASSRKKRKKEDSLEETFDYFGASNPKQPKTTALAILNCLSNGDIYMAALVNKNWSKLAMDEELWKFSEQK